LILIRQQRQDPSLEELYRELSAANESGCGGRLTFLAEWLHRLCVKNAILGFLCFPVHVLLQLSFCCAKRKSNAKWLAGLQQTREHLAFLSQMEAQALQQLDFRSALAHAPLQEPLLG